MFTKDKNNIPLYYFKNLYAAKGLSHYVTCRQGGVSYDEYESMNLSFNVGDRPDYVRFNRFKLATELGIHADRLIFPKQTHGNTIKTIDSGYLLLDSHKKAGMLESTDALITTEPFLCLSVLLADCVPILFYHKNPHVIGVAHAGWKGTFNKIVQLTAEKLYKDFSCNPKNMLIGVGPSIGPKNYSIDAELANKFEHEFPKYKSAILTKHSKTHYLLNLWELNKLQLLETGIPETNIEVAETCTFENSELFFSHRKSGGKTGRFAAGIMLK